jgi:hypothetical protein
MPKQLGVLPDTRTPEQKEFDILRNEVASGESATATYVSPDAAKSYVRKFPIDDQFQTSSCVAHGKVLAASIFMYMSDITPSFVQLSSMFLYRNRSNYPEAGMIPASADTQFEQAGAPPYADIPTPQTEEEANALPTPDAATTQAAKLFAGLRWVTLVDPTDFETIAYVSNNESTPLNILIYATEQEWSQPTVEILSQGLQQSDPSAVIRHCVTVLPNSAYVLNGKGYVVIQDSVGYGDTYFRAVSEDFIKARCYECAYPISFDNTPVLTRPTYTFNTDLTVGSTGPDVVALQQILQYLGYLPNVLNDTPFAPTGTYAGLTKAAVLQLQNEYAAEILTPAGLTVGTGYCGASTRAFLNKLFG